MIKMFIKKIKWIRNGKPMIHYTGYHCGCCGRWINENFSIPKYKSLGDYWDTVGLCDKCYKRDSVYH